MATPSKQQPLNILAGKQQQQPPGGVVRPTLAPRQPTLQLSAQQLAATLSRSAAAAGGGRLLTPVSLQQVYASQASLGTTFQLQAAKHPPKGAAAAGVSTLASKQQHLSKQQPLSLTIVAPGFSGLALPGSQQSTQQQTARPLLISGDAASKQAVELTSDFGGVTSAGSVT